MNTCAAKGCSSSHSICTISSFLTSVATMSPRSLASGMYLTISFIRFMTPRLYRALPAITGTVFMLCMPLRMPWIISSRSRLPVSKYFSKRTSSFSAAVSMSESCIAASSSFLSSGTGISSGPVPVKWKARSVRAFTKPAILLPSIMGICMGAILP